ncbi:mercury resistance system periplasmic binding protein MerP [Burkholderia vietnamiensis]|jgi:mercuric ion binding protein|uniref:Periplasmic mercury ion-binding protein n=2 Tax=Burkholderia cepacia complex TaxID=87882 RepID=A0AAW7SXC9_BURVI|nr:MULTISPECIES: mercury resistance system periplasmic binding protein MerP [Burkholderia]EJH4594914.1 mercury resistance system periplasmic binding protein MerP [Listeria monocytogenes]AXK68095.1 mercury resistance system periplasmic binding protein MerP [Burkholderia sp. IDO3]KVR84587.1 mercuric transport protein periplasmic component [Burkholderia vietnamiensis]MBH9646494.1 mercury resistance system periplasmic binding protein MerP [Burkholderia vietnamiensis]MBR8009157.1 mercury resistance
MKRFVVLAALAATLSAPAWAAMKTVALSVPGMTCASCPVTVRAALKRVDGVKDIAVIGETDIQVTYDDARTNVAALINATKNAGYPSSVKQ